MHATISLRLSTQVLVSMIVMGVADVGRAEESPLVRELMQSNMDTSSAAIAPPWSMKPWLWEDDVNTTAAVWDLVDGCRDHDLPLGAVLIDSPWATRYNNFRFDEARYPDPRGMIDALHKRDVRLVLWMTNVINTPESLADAVGDEEDLYTIGKDKGYFINGGEPVSWWKGKGAMIDYTNPEAVAWWHRVMDRTLSLGVDGWKMDGSAELFIRTKRQTSRGTMSWRDYIDLYYRDTLNYSRTCQPDFVTMVRSVDIANSGGIDQPHAPFDAAPITWTGDQRHSWKDKGLNEAIRSGFRALERDYPSVSSDTGGYQTAAKEQTERMPRVLYLRWAQWNALTPFFLIGGHDEHRPWKFDSEFFQIFRRYMWLHQELVPFFYSQHVQTNLREGKLMHLGPGRHEFMLGDSLLAAVMSSEDSHREITFPEGIWLDYWDNRIEHRGGETIHVDVPADRSPLFVRRGAIIPLDVENDAVKHGSAASKGWRTLDIYPAAEASTATIWDTRTFPPQVARDRSFVVLSPGGSGMELRVDGGPTRDTIFRILREKVPQSVTLEGKPLAAYPSGAEWEKSQSGWWFDVAEQRLWIRLAAVKNTRVTITN
ncbi:MAG TPA: TIM-barrel domain-containing protein [Pirellulales bacterium]|jgi:alpha-glucosidase (family GH31 glycosyl hydrolase)